MEVTKRFSNRVENYRKYRPRYPVEVIAFLEKEIGLSPSSVVADIGAGTGIFTDLLLKHGSTVYAVEPNAPMREAAESDLSNYDNFHSVDATAEATTLANNSIDAIICAQAFHWFKIMETRAEFKRILKQNGWVVLIWNLRNPDSTPFLAAYEQFLLNFGTDYPVAPDEDIPDTVKAFFDSSSHKLQTFYNSQDFDFEGLKGRLLSSSYIPVDGANYDEMLSELREIFDTYNSNGIVTFVYETTVYYGHP